MVREWKFGAIIELQSDKKKTKIVSVYNNAGVEQVKSKLEAILEEAIKDNEEIIIVGDWNAL